MKKILSVCISVILVACMSVIPVYAADSNAHSDSNAKIASVAKTLENTYGISITYPKNSSGKAMISMNNLETLDLAFSTITPELMRQVSSYYENKNGRKIEVQYYFSDSDYSYNGGVLMAAFDPRTSQIIVFLPAKAGRAIISGENPIALVHEVGHAFHLMCMDTYGDQKMMSEWISFNRGYRYSSDGLNEKFDKNVFISSYARTSFMEDFAETFGHTFVRTAAGTGFRNQLSNDSKITGLGEKVNYVEKLVNTYIKNSTKAVQNFRKIYNTPTSIEFEGVTFHGEPLQYSGYPQPKNILKGILNAVGLKSQKSTWIRTIGAWRVIDSKGDTYYIFPGGAAIRAVQQKKAA